MKINFEQYSDTVIVTIIFDDIFSVVTEYLNTYSK